MKASTIANVFLFFMGLYDYSDAESEIDFEYSQKLEKTKLGKYLMPNPDGLEFLAQNQKLPGVTVLPSGVQYKVERAGLGMYHPTKHSVCRIHYEGHSREGTRFDSSYARDRIIKTRPDHLVKGLEEVIPMMVEGDIWEIFVPAHLGYSSYHSSSHDGLDHSDVTIFKIWLVDILGEKIDAIDRCDITSLVGCNGSTKTYIENSLMRYRTADRMKIQVKKLEKKLHRGPATSEMKHDLHNKIHILNVLINHKESGGSFPTSERDEL